MFSISPFAIPIIAIIMGGLFPIFRAYAKKMEASANQPAIPGELMGRLERMEHSLDAIAVEVERISEGQRFTTKLLSEHPRDGQKIAAKSESSSGQPA